MSDAYIGCRRAGGKEGVQMENFGILTSPARVWFRG